MFADFEALTKAYDKAKKVIDKEGIPRFYIRTLVELEDFVAEVCPGVEGIRLRHLSQQSQPIDVTRQ